MCIIMLILISTDPITTWFERRIFQSIFQVLHACFLIK